MPLLRRVNRKEIRLSPEVRAAALSPERWRRHWKSDKQAQLAWLSLGKMLSRHGLLRSETFWALEPGVPSDLREQVPAPEYRWVLSEKPVRPRDHVTVVAVYQAQHRRRVEWLLETGRLSHGDEERARKFLGTDVTEEDPE